MLSKEEIQTLTSLLHRWSGCRVEMVPMAGNKSIQIITNEKNFCSINLSKNGQTIKLVGMEIDT